MVLPDSHRVSRALCYSGFVLKDLLFRLRVFHALWTALPGRSAISNPLNARPTTPTLLRILVWAGPISLAATAGITCLFSFPTGTKMVQFPAFALPFLFIQKGVLFREGCPIQISSDQSPLGGSPGLVAACHVFHRFSIPRHPLCALIALSLTPLGLSLHNSYLFFTNYAVFKNLEPSGGR